MKKLGIILFGLALLAQPVQAQPWTPTYAPPIGDGDIVTYAFGGVESPAVPNAWGYWGGPYFINLGPAGARATVYCADFYTLVKKGTRIQAQALSLGNPGNFPVDQRWGSRTTMNAVPLENFKKAAYIASLFPTFAPNADAVKFAQGAIWWLTSGHGPYTPRTNPGVARVLAMADQGWERYGNYDQWMLLKTTQVGRNEFGMSQHFLVQTVTPEPQTYVLLGSGLLFLVFVGRRRLKENGYS